MSCTAEGVGSTRALRLKQLSQGGSTEESTCAAEEKCQSIAIETLASFPHLKDQLLLLCPANEYGMEKFACTYERARRGQTVLDCNHRALLLMSCTAEGLGSTRALRLKQLSQGDSTEESTCVEEEKCHAVLKSFRGNVSASFPDLKDQRLLLLCPANEYGVEKFACTFLKPTLLPYPELYDLRSCACFVANYIQYEPLESGPDTSTSVTVVSPAQTLDWAAGDCFDCSFLLASLLLGAGYDAFVVCGTAPDWLRLKDQSHMTIGSQSSNQSHMTIGSQSSNEENDVANPRRVETLIEDKHEGVHCWLLVKAGKRDVAASVFVEPSTGAVYPCDATSPYCHVYSVLNDKICWVKVKDGSIAEAGLDLTNSETWRPVLPNDNSTPFSWVRPLSLSKDKFELRYPPDGKRTINLDRAKLQLFGKDVNPQGLVSQVLRYEDPERLIVVECTELYCPTQREDHLVRRTRRPKENLSHEIFSNRSDLSERTETPGMRCVKFREKTRADGLVERSEEIGSSITEHFRNRTDGLVRREVYLSAQSEDEESKRQPKAELIPLGDGRKAVVERIDDHFEAPTDTSDIDNAVSCRSYLLKDHAISVNYHCEHAVLQKTDSYNKDDLAKGDSQLLKLENAAVSDVKRTQTEMHRLDEAKYQHEMSMSSDPSAGEAKPSTAVGPSKHDEAKGATYDYLSPYLQGHQGPLTKEEATQVKESCLGDAKDRMMERAAAIQEKLDTERQRLSDDLGSAEGDIRFRIEVLQKRLVEYEERSIAKYQDLEKRLKEDIRLASLDDE